MFQAIIALMETEQHHAERSEYRFERLEPSPPSDSLPFDGRGTRVNFTGMIWSGFRPSDDACRFGYLVPANMLAVVVLGYLATMAREIYDDAELAERASKLQTEIEFGIQTYGVVEHPRFGRIYAYETDGFGNYNLMDDANVPSLLAIPYMQYRPADDPMYVRTRRFVLSKSNPYYFQGRAARGVGSPHTPQNYIWPIALSMQGLTATSREEQDEVLDLLVGTTAGTNYMHESFDADDPTQFTRPWFAWANSLFSEFLLHYLHNK
jgi:meiotically up-regulated gene 157 (Mug157) protein